MAGYCVTFTLDLLKVPIYLVGKGEARSIVVESKSDDYIVQSSLVNIDSPRRHKDDGGDLFFFDKVILRFTSYSEDLANHQFIKGRALAIIFEMQPVIVNSINKFILFFKYRKMQLKLREVNIFDFFDQEDAVFRPRWTDLEGKEIDVQYGNERMWYRGEPGTGFLKDRILGATPYNDSDKPELESFFELPSVDLYEKILSDAQAAAVVDNLRQAILELAISIEVFVKNFFFKREGVSGAVFEYMEDRGQSIKVMELIDSVSMSAFNASFKVDSPSSYKSLDLLFRCRNKIAHKGESRYRDEAGGWCEAGWGDFDRWWSNTMELFRWLRNR